MLADQVRAISAAKIAEVLKATEGKREIEVLLAISAACPFGFKTDRAIWIEEVDRLMYGEGEKKV